MLCVCEECTDTDKNWVQMWHHSLPLVSRFYYIKLSTKMLSAEWLYASENLSLLQNIITYHILLLFRVRYIHNNCQITVSFHTLFTVMINFIKDTLINYIINSIISETAIPSSGKEQSLNFMSTYAFEVDKSFARIPQVFTERHWVDKFRTQILPSFAISCDLQISAFMYPSLRRSLHLFWCLHVKKGDHYVQHMSTQHNVKSLKQRKWRMTRAWPEV